MVDGLLSVLKFIPVDLPQIEVGKGVGRGNPNLPFQFCNGFIKLLLGDTDNG
jgi:hypothetical protein